MTVAGFAILVVLVLLIIWVFVTLAGMPGRKATERGHPQAEAINILGWIGLLFAGAPWLVALVWAYTKPTSAGSVPSTGNSLAQDSAHPETETS